MMPIRWLSIRGYRSAQRVRLGLGQINVIVGPNGSGKSNLYRSLFLLHRAAEGQLARTLAQEGGMPSCLWAGEYYKGQPKRVTIEVGFDEWSYCFACGLPGNSPRGSAFTLDPLIREERLDYRGGPRPTTVFERKNGSAHLRDEQGSRIAFPMALSDSESILSELREPHRYPELSALRSVLCGWRFYHQFRTDSDSPLRRPQIGVRTPVLRDNGTDLAAALQTIYEIGDGPGLHAAVSDAFPGANLHIEMSTAGMEAQLERTEFRRRFSAAELSDGTLKYFSLLAALLTPRPPALLAINEPDANLHPQLLEPLARLIALAGRESQLWITTHSQFLADTLAREANARLIQLEMKDGATVVAGGLPTNVDEGEPDEE